MIYTITVLAAISQVSFGMKPNGILAELASLCDMTDSPDNCEEAVECTVDGAKNEVGLFFKKLRRDDIAKQAREELARRFLDGKVGSLNRDMIRADSDWTDDESVTWATTYGGVMDSRESSESTSEETAMECDVNVADMAELPAVGQVEKVTYVTSSQFGINFYDNVNGDRYGGDIENGQIVIGVVNLDHPNWVKVETVGGEEPELPAWLPIKDNDDDVWLSLGQEDGDEGEDDITPMRLDDVQCRVNRKWYPCQIQDREIMKEFLGPSFDQLGNNTIVIFFTGETLPPGKSWSVPYAVHAYDLRSGSFRRPLTPNHARRNMSGGRIKTLGPNVIIEYTQIPEEEVQMRGKNGKSYTLKFNWKCKCGKKFTSWNQVNGTSKRTGEKHFKYIKYKERDGKTVRYGKTICRKLWWESLSTLQQGRIEHKRELNRLTNRRTTKKFNENWQDGTYVGSDGVRYRYGCGPRYSAKSGLGSLPAFMCQ